MTIIHKLNITAEAKFDLLDMGFHNLNQRTLKAEIEFYLTSQDSSGRLPLWEYFRFDYEDEFIRLPLKLFIFKGVRLGPMQFWELRGVCQEDDWDEDFEHEGQIRAWVNSLLAPPDSDDWVIAHRVNQVLKNTTKTKWHKVLQEVLNEFECERDKKLAKELAISKSLFFAGGSDSVKPKARRNRKIHKNP